MTFPQAYHITWGTHGTRLHGSEKPHVDRWTIHALASQRDHTHVVITALREGTELRDALKAVASRALNNRFGKQKWWAEGGSARYLWERSYFENAVKYVNDQRDF